jgi:hypothetical protein
VHKELNELINQLQLSKYNAPTSHSLTCSTDKSHFPVFFIIRVTKGCMCIGQLLPQMAAAMFDREF